MTLLPSINKNQTSGKIRWTLPLSDDGNTLTAADSVLFVASRQEVSAVSDGGQLLWKSQLKERESSSYPPQLFSFDDCIVHYANNQITTFGIGAGEILHQASLSPFSYGASLDAFHIVFSRSAPRTSPACLWCKSVSGEVLWKLPMGRRSISPPLVINGLILVSDGLCTWAVNAEGEILWRADESGIEQGSHEIASLSATKSIPHVVQAISKGCAIATLDAQSKYLLNTQSPATALLPVAPRDEALGGLPSEEAVLWRGSSRQDYPGGPCQWPIFATNIEGETLWTINTAAKPTQFLADDCSFYLVFSPEFSYWEKYGQWYDFPCQIQRFSLKGELMATWKFESPIGVVEIFENQVFALSGSSLHALEINE